MRAQCLAMVLAVAAVSGVTRGAFIDLTPAGSTNAVATSISGHEVGGYSDATGDFHAWSWNLDTGGNDIHPSTLSPGDWSFVFGVGPGTQVGFVELSSTQHAAMWSGTAGSYVQLNETGFSNRSSVAAINGGVAVGTGALTGPSQDQALVWATPGNTGVAPVALPTPGTFAGIAYVASGANGISGTHVVGSATLDAPSGVSHAALWNITNIATPTFTVIHPTGFTDSTALGISGNQIVGSGDELISGLTHAILWTMSGDTVASVTDLNPGGEFTVSEAFASNGVDEVGYAQDGDGNNHAMLWEGTAASAVDLSLLLPAGEFVSSQALGINDEGMIVGLGIDTLGNTHAIVWAPEPGTLGILAIGAAGLLRRRRR